MPTTNKTFSGGDIVRLWCNHLTQKEQNEIVLFFLLIVPGILLTDAQLTLILTTIRKHMPGRIMRGVISLLIRYSRFLRGIIHEVWANIIFENEDTRREVVKCIEKRVSSSL